MKTQILYPLGKAILCAAVGLFLPMSTVLAQEAPPEAPSDIQAVVVVQPDGSRAVQISWLDNSENEMGFVVIDQSTGRQYDSLPNPEGRGTRMSMILPVDGGCFQMFAYNNYGESAHTTAVCALSQPGAGQIALIAGLAGLALAAVILAVVILFRRRVSGTKTG
jgi:hypothetical protein